MRTTAGHLLDGRLHYAQPEDGYRTGIEPVLLAAAVPAQPGDRVLEAGCGAGAALMCLAWRVPGLQGVGVELDPDMADLARRNIAANGLPDLSVITGDILADPPPGRFRHAMANPPWHDPDSTASPVGRRSLAKQRSGPGIAGWIAALAGGLDDLGSLTLILPASAVAAAMQAMQSQGLNGVETPLWPKDGRAAKLAVLTGRRGAEPGVTAPGVVLHEADGRYRPEIQAVLREGRALPLSPSAPAPSPAAPHG